MSKIRCNNLKDIQQFLNKMPAERSYFCGKHVNNIQYMKKFLHFDWLRAMQFLGNTVPKKEVQCQKKKFSANVFRF